MIISEFLPNPSGKDPAGEWIKLFNESSETINLAGWQIKDASGKTFIFPAEGGKNQIVSASEYLTLDYKTTKVSLNNNGETLFLYNQKGELIDKAEFVGTAPEGKVAKRRGDSLVFSVFDESNNPLSGEVEQKTAFQEFSGSDAINYPVALNKKAFDLDILAIAFFTAAALAFVFVIILRKVGEFPD